jgi:hypothetical protein
MASEMRRMARALVEHRSARYPAPFPRDEAEERVQAALDPIRPSRLRLERRWVDGSDGLELQTELLPTARITGLLRVFSLVLAALLAAAAWALLSDRVDRTLAFIVTIAAVLWVLGMPLVLAAFGAQREAEEAGIARALKRALTDAGEAAGDRSR